MGLTFVDIFLSPISNIYFPLICVQELLAKNFQRSILTTAILISNLDSACLNCIRKDEIS